MRGGVVLCVLVAAGAIAPTAQGAPATILYECFPNLCEVRADSRDARRITTRGTPRRPYSRPTRSLDGRRLAFTAPSGHAYIREAGRTRRIGFTHGAVVLHPRLRAALFYFMATRSETWLCKYLPAGGRPVCFGGTGFTGWGPGIDLLSMTEFDVSRWEISATRFRRVRVLATPRRPATFGVKPALSPDARWLVVPEVMLGEPEEVRLALYSFRTGRRVRELTRGHVDEFPTWSPDGRRVAFVRDRESGDRPSEIWVGAIHVVPLSGGRTVRVARRGFSPFWGT